MASKLTRKIAETRAAIADEKRRIERAQSRIQELEIRLQAYLELGGRAHIDRKKPVKMAPPARVLFKSEVPWDRGLAALRKSGPEFTTDDLIEALAKLRSRPKRSTVRDKLAVLAKPNGMLERIKDGHYRFLAGSERRAA